MKLLANLLDDSSNYCIRLTVTQNIFIDKKSFELLHFTRQAIESYDPSFAHKLVRQLDYEKYIGTYCQKIKKDELLMNFFDPTLKN